jgi:hypothetical protein
LWPLLLHWGFRVPCNNLPHRQGRQPTPPSPAFAAADDLTAFLQRSAAALKPGGVLFVKENVCQRGFIVDNQDASVTR